ncbi:MAG: type II secretion system major pseudopilin GspG, partial [Phycisphaerales bacterium JB038]
RHVSDARVQAAKQQIQALELALDSYAADVGAYPSTAEGLQVLRAPPASIHSDRWRGPYLRRAVPEDHWGRPYIYLYPGEVNETLFDLGTLGRDGLPGGVGEDADVTNWSEDR